MSLQDARTHSPAPDSPNSSYDSHRQSLCDPASILRDMAMFISGSKRIRTSNPRFRRPMLYPIELWILKFWR